VRHTVAGQTLGKSVVGVRVVGTDGARLTFGPFLRYLASGLPLATCGFGLMALRRDKRALHDLIAGSRVGASSAAPDGPSSHARRPLKLLGAGRVVAAARPAADDAGRAPAAQRHAIAGVIPTLPLRAQPPGEHHLAALGDVARAPAERARD
jgi:hypothetical protein